MHQFYLPHLVADQVAQKPVEYTFDEQESKHIAKVLRLQKGDLIRITDGEGFLYEATVVEPHIKETLVRIANPVADPNLPACQLHVAIAPTKNPDRMEWFVEKATEVGVDQITLLLCEHSERPRLKTDRLERIAIAALKQSKRSRLPRINPMVQFDRFVDTPTAGDKFIAWCESSSRAFLPHQLTPGNHATLLIGPEGDFSIREVEMAQKSGYIPTGLGNYTLRTETAGLAACFIFNHVNHR